MYFLKHTNINCIDFDFDNVPEEHAPGVSQMKCLNVAKKCFCQIHTESIKLQNNFIVIELFYYKIVTRLYLK